MFPYSPSVTPAVKSHLDAQMAFFNDVSRSMFRTVQQFSDLHLHMAQTMLEDAAQTGCECLTAERATDMISAATNRAQPASDKLRAYQQHLSRIAADTQMEMSKVAGEHVESTSRTAKALAEEVARSTQEETQRALQKQQASVERSTDPFRQNGQRTHDGQDGQDGHDRQPMSAQAAAPSAAQTGAQSASQGSRQSGARKES
ncbi:granule-associated protein [Duganella sp. Leaf126]|uniref:phasin family protein n=1 Tax=Duganella sp. Leaf126 TaxID=1736266 RepID=UPI0006FFA5E5|nr:phasin family protein [Duganella sp. Leaf126]KQQ40209.1 granule-associated protein [Duganella sp. Leaf126]